MISFNFSFSLCYLFDEIQKGGELLGKPFMVRHAKLYEHVIFIGFCLSSKRGRLLAFLKSFFIGFDERQKEIDQLAQSSCYIRVILIFILFKYVMIINRY